VTWRKPPEKLVRFLEESLRDFDCEMRKMFGCPSYFIQGNMFVGAYQESLFLRLSAKERKKALAQYPGIKPFEPVPGRIMREYVAIPADIYANEKAFSKLLAKSVDYVSSLPRKERGGRTKKKI